MRKISTMPARQAASRAASLRDKFRRAWANYFKVVRAHPVMEFEPEKGHLIARCIVEILGKPEQHVKDTIELVVKEMKGRRKIQVLESKVETPTRVEGLWASFAEVEVLFAGFEELATFCFDFMPSSVEVLEPGNIGLEAPERSEEHTSELQSQSNLVCRLLLEK